MISIWLRDDDDHWPGIPDSFLGGSAPGLQVVRNGSWDIVLNARLLPLHQKIRFKIDRVIAFASEGTLSRVTQEGAGRQGIHLVSVHSCRLARVRARSGLRSLPGLGSP